MYSLYIIYDPHSTKYVVYAANGPALHEIIDLKHRSSHFRLDPLNTEMIVECKIGLQIQPGTGTLNTLSVF